MARVADSARSSRGWAPVVASRRLELREPAFAVAPAGPHAQAGRVRRPIYGGGAHSPPCNPLARALAVLEAHALAHDADARRVELDEHRPAACQQSDETPQERVRRAADA